MEAEPLPGCDINRAAQPTDTTAGVDSVLGQVVTVTEATFGNTTLTSWRASGLDCEELYYRSEQKQGDGSRKLVVEMTTSVLLMGDPDPALFTIDESYSNLQPASNFAARVGVYGLPLPEDERERLFAQAKAIRKK